VAVANPKFSRRDALEQTRASALSAWRNPGRIGTDSCVEALCDPYAQEKHRGRCFEGQGREYREGEGRASAATGSTLRFPKGTPRPARGTFRSTNP
jgi:hypothetical protein